jgi:hypothetical protein
MARIKAGDVVVVCKLDRLGRSTRELLDLIDRMGHLEKLFSRRSTPWVDPYDAAMRTWEALDA